MFGATLPLINIIKSAHTIAKYNLEAINMERKYKILTVILMCVNGFAMHYMYDLIKDVDFLNWLGAFYPVNETTWEHMKLYWFPFVVTGTILAIITKKKSYFGAFTIAGIIAMIVQLGLFAFYQSFTGESVMWLGITLYFVITVICAWHAFMLAKKEWVAKSFIMWIIIAIAVTCGFICLTYNPGDGYIFWDDDKYKKMQQL